MGRADKQKIRSKESKTSNTNNIRIRKAIKEIQNKEAHGSGETLPELKKYGSQKLHRKIQPILQRAINVEQPQKQ